MTEQTLELFQHVSLRKRELEWLFAACAFVEPANTILECGFLLPGDLDDNRLRKYWTILLDTRDPFKAAQESDSLMDLLDNSSAVNSWQAKEYATLVKRSSFLVKLAQKNQELAKAISQNDYNETRKLIEEMSMAIPFAPNRVITAVEGFESLIDIINNPQRRTVKTYIPVIDQATGGLERQTMSVLAARPQMGKSTLAWQICQQIAAAQGTALFVSLEMSRDHLFGKAACGDLGYRWSDVINGKLTEEQKIAATNKAGELMGIYADRLMVADDSGQTTSDVWQQVSRHRPDLVVVDHLALLADESERETLRLGQMSWRLKSIAKQFDCHVMVVAQLNRGVEFRNEQRPRLSDLRDSGKIEENADNVFMLYRDDYYKEQAPGRYSETELLIRKARYDLANGRVMLNFDTSKQWFGRLP